MWLSLPLLAFLLTFAAICRRQPGLDPRAGFIWAAVVWGVFTAGLTEVLSRFNALSAGPMALSWGAAALCAALLNWRLPNSNHHWSLGLTRRPSPLTLALSLAIAVVVLITGLLAVVGRPNEGDSHRYHLSRVMHWVQNGSVEFYPTHILNQLYLPPWAEYAALQLMVLGGDDRLAQLVQWFSMLGCVVGVSLIAACLGASARGQLVSALFCALLPMGILQAASTQNDYVAAFWLVCLVYALLAWRADPASPHDAALAGASLGLAVLTKATAYFFAAPLLLLPFGRRDARAGTRLAQVGLAGLIALSLNAPQYARNLELFGSIVGPSTGSPSYPAGQINAQFSAPILASNLFRNAALHLGTPLPALNSTVEQVVKRLHDWLGIDLNDPRSTWQPNFYPFTVPRAPGDEATAGNPIHLVVILATLLAAAIQQSWRARPLVWQYCLALLLGFGLLCLVFKWRLFGSHWQLPLFVLWAPVIGLLLQRQARLIGLVAIAMLAWATPYLLWSDSHPLLGERSVLFSDSIDQYLRHNPSARAPYLDSTGFLRAQGCAQVGLVLPSFSLEYPFWALLPEVQADGGRLEHVVVDNVSDRFWRRRPPFTPCAVLAVRQPSAESLRLDDRAYRRVWSNAGVEIFTPAGSGS